MSIPARIPVAILGATGTVGQRFIARLADHPWFEVTRVFASARSAGQPYKRAAGWLQPSDMPKAVRNLEVEATTPAALAQLASQGIAVVFSALGTDEALAFEPAAAAGGATVFSNASAFRMHPSVPLVIPEVNAEHLALALQQSWPLDAAWETAHAHSSHGAIITNPNCSTVGLVMSLAPLARRFGLRRVHVVTLQALSGAGLVNGQPLSIGDTIVPNIPGEADKLRTEPHKLLGELVDAVTVHTHATQPTHGSAPHQASGAAPIHASKSSNQTSKSSSHQATGDSANPKGIAALHTQLEIEPATFQVSATTTRVPVSHGHTLCVSVELERPATRAQLIEVWQTARARPQELKLPSAPLQPIHFYEETDAPQPLHHRNLEAGMAIAIGQLEREALFADRDDAASAKGQAQTKPNTDPATHGWKFITLSHNLERGAAGGSILNAELWWATRPK